MNSFYSTYNYNARLDRISIDRSIEPIKKEATLRLSKQNIPTAVANGSTVQPSTDQHLMEVHVDGRLLVITLVSVHLLKLLADVLKGTLGSEPAHPSNIWRHPRLDRPQLFQFQIGEDNTTRPTTANTRRGKTTPICKSDESRT